MTVTLAKSGVDIDRLFHNHRVVDKLSTTLTALSDPTRRAILVRLARGPKHVAELAQPFAISQQAISKHLAYLYRAKLIKKRRQGRQSLCAINPAPFSDVAAWMESCHRFWEESFERLDLVLEKMKGEVKHDP